MPQLRLVLPVLAILFCGSAATAQVDFASIDAFLAKTRAKMWIQHDFTGNAQLKKAPAYYE